MHRRHRPDREAQPLQGEDRRAAADAPRATWLLTTMTAGFGKGCPASVDAISASRREASGAKRRREASVPPAAFGSEDRCRQACAPAGAPSTFRDRTPAPSTRRGRSPADVLIFDLEDSVAPEAEGRGPRRGRRRRRRPAPTAGARSWSGSTASTRPGSPATSPPWSPPGPTPILVPKIIAHRRHPPRPRRARRRPGAEDDDASGR